MAVSTVSPRRVVLLALVAGVSLAGLVAIGAIVSHSFDRTDAQLVATSLGFSVFSALGAAGARAEQRAGCPPALGRITSVGAAISFAVLLLALWVNHDVATWRIFGTVGVATLAGSHACLVLSASRATDSSFVSGLATTSIATGSTDSVLGALAITGAMQRVDAGYARLLAILVIVMLVTTALPPLLRRLASKPGPNPFGLPAKSADATAHSSQSSELLVIAARLESPLPSADEEAFRLREAAAQLRRIAATLDR